MRQLSNLVLAFGLALAATTANAQMQVAFGGLKQDPSLPVEMSADQLEIDQNDGSAVFTGNVVIGQGEMRLSAPRVRIEYVTADGQPTGEISRMIATGGVTLVNGAEAAEASRADYTVTKGEILMTGDVLLTQGVNALSSDRMTVDLTTGRAVMEGRVKTVLQSSKN